MSPSISSLLQRPLRAKPETSLHTNGGENMRVQYSKESLGQLSFVFVCRGIAALLEIICQRGSQNVDLRRSRKGCQWQRVLRLLMYDPDLITYNCAPGLRPPWTPDRQVPVLMTSTSWPSLINSLSARRSSHAKSWPMAGSCATAGDDGRGSVSCDVITALVLGGL